MLADFRAVDTVETVHLQGLSPEAVEALVQRWTTAPSDLVPQLCRLTDGNPLFLDEMLRQLCYRDDEKGGAADTPVPPDLNPPEAIRELVARRVSRLPEDVIYLLQAAAVAGLECEAGIAAEAAGLTAGQRLDAFDGAEDSRLLRRIGEEARDRYAFTHALVRDAIYGELLRGRRVRYHHKIAVATERAHAEELDTYVNELAHHFFMGAALADVDKAIHYCMAAGDRALRLFAFEEAVGHFTRSLEVAERFDSHDLASRCDALIALGEAHSRGGDPVHAHENFKTATVLARSMGDAERLATAALRSGTLRHPGIFGPSEDQVQLLEEASAALPEEDSHLRAMVTARLGLDIVYAHGVPPEPGVFPRSLALNTDAVAMARRIGDRSALGYALNARMHALWGIEPAPERLAIGTEIGEIADDVGDELLALHGHMWRIRELLAQGDVDAVNHEIARFEARDIRPPYPLEAAYGHNVAAMMALIAGDFEGAESLAQRAMEVAEAYNELALVIYGALMVWAWWQRDELGAFNTKFHDVVEQEWEGYPTSRAIRALAHAEGGETDRALAELHSLSKSGWKRAGDLTEGVALALAGAACEALGEVVRDVARNVYEELRPHAGTAVVIRAPAAACVGPADQYLGLLAATWGNLALAEVHFEGALRLAHRMGSAPFVAAAEVELARTLRRRGREDESERVAVLLRSAEECALRMGLHRLARRAAEPG